MVVSPPGTAVIDELSSPPLNTFSRPILAMIFSDGVIGNITKKMSISKVRTIKLAHDTSVTLVDLLRPLVESEFFFI